MRKIFVVISALALLSSCGVMTKTRYCIGLKLDLGNTLLAKKEKTEEIKAKKAMKVISNYKLVEKQSIISIYQISKLDSVEIKTKLFEEKQQLPTNIIFLPNINNNISIKEESIQLIEPYKPLEPHVQIGAYLFFGSIDSYFNSFFNFICSFANCLFNYVILFISKFYSMYNMT